MSSNTAGKAFWLAHDDELRKYVEEEGLTASEAAQRIGVTKNAVMGRATRVGLVWSRPPKGGYAKWYIKPQPIFDPFPGPGRCLYGFGDVRNKAEFRFCGEPVEREGEAWCLEHRKRVYQPVSLSR